MIKGDAGMESIYTWSEHTKRESFRGASGGGDGVHVLTGPIAVDGAEPGDVLKVEIVDLRPRANPDGKTYGSNANAWWGFQARVPKADGSNYDAGAFTSTPGSNDEVITIYELASDDPFFVPSHRDWVELCPESFPVARGRGKHGGSNPIDSMLRGKLGAVARPDSPSLGSRLPACPVSSAAALCSPLLLPARAQTHRIPRPLASTLDNL